MAGRLGLTNGQMISCLVQGTALWLAAAVLLRWLGPMGIYQDPVRFWVYLLVIPGTVPVVFQIEKLARLQHGQIFTGMAIGTMAAMFLDGIALAWFPALYGPTVELHAGAGAVILWGAAVGMALGWLRTKAA